ncbi:MAG: S41 family peptidase [Verrucomicrobiae bacterium]|nr:S41 family peptidase [Verrucomicrobiae bacterium]
MIVPHPRLNLLVPLCTVVLCPLLSSPIRAATNENTPVPAITIRKSDKSELSEVLQVIKKNYADPAAVSETTLNAAALEGILRKLAPGVQVLDQKEIIAALPRFSALNPHFEIVPEDIAYIYTGNITPSTPGFLETTLASLPVTVRGLVLDLRFSQGTDLKAAAQSASLFVGAGQPLFRVKNLKNEDIQLYSSEKAARHNLDTPLVLVVNRETAGNAEAFVAALKEQRRALIIGVETSGKGAQFSDVALSSGRILRLATHRIVPNNGLQIFPYGLTPDIAVAMTSEEQMKALLKARSGKVQDVVVETVTRKRLNEASLVRNENPAYDQAVENQRKAREKETGPGREPPEKPVRDLVLQRAVDVIKGIQVLNLGTH